NYGLAITKTAIHQKQMFWMG
ncbi:hypothetical protein QE152_g30049, partial [Popillia japonica]